MKHFLLLFVMYFTDCLYAVWFLLCVLRFSHNSWLSNTHPFFRPVEDSALCNVGMGLSGLFSFFRICNDIQLTIYLIRRRISAIQYILFHYVCFFSIHCVLFSVVETSCVLREMHLLSGSIFFLTILENIFYVVFRVCCCTKRKENLTLQFHTVLPPTSQLEKSCSICLGDFVAEKKVVGLSCDHYYHEPCIRQWFHVRFKCPLCNKEFRKEEFSNMIV